MSQTGSGGQTSGLSIASLVLSCSSVLLGPFGFIPGIILGFMALRQLRRHPEQTGQGLASAGIIVGFVFAVVFVAAVAVIYRVLQFYYMSLE
jgi:hypothetical protein